MAKGDTTAGLDSLNLAAEYGWNPTVFRSIRETRLALGDTLSALHNFAKVAVDPVSDSLFADSVPDLLGSAFDLELWYGSTLKAQEEMQSWVLAEADPRRLPDQVRLRNQNGSNQTLQELTEGRVSLVIFWNRACGPALHQLPDIRDLVRRLEREGVTAVAITDEQPSEEFTKFWNERELNGFPLFHDYKAEASRAFINFATPEYHVLDSEGRIVFSASEFEEIPRQVAVLKPLIP